MNLAQSPSPASQPAETVTVITCEEGSLLAKRYVPGSVTPVDYDRVTLVQPISVEIEDLADLYDLLEGLQSDPQSCIIRGAPKPDVQEGDWVPRRYLDQPDQPAAFDACARRWLAIDVDETKTPIDLQDVRASVEAWRETLPEELRGAAMIFQASAKAHLSPTVRGRAFVWLTHLAADDPLREWARVHSFDPAIYNPVQPIYTAAPVFDEGAGPDPLAGQRLIWLDGGVATLDLSVVAERLPRVAGQAYTGSDDVLRKAHAHASRLPPSVEGFGGDDALFHAARELATLGLPAPALASVLRETYNPRCTPPWPEHTLERQAQRAAATHALTLRQYKPGARRAALAALAEIGDDAENDNAGRQDGDVPPVPAVHPWDVVGRLCDQSDTGDEDLKHICKALHLHPYKGKITLFAGDPGSAKGPCADHIAVCVAANKAIFGAFEVDRSCNVAILDFEGAVGTKKRVRRICRDMGIGWPEGLHIFEADPLQVSRQMSEDGSDPWLEGLRAFCTAKGIGMLVIDSYTSAMLASGTESSRDQYATLMQRLGRLEGVAVVAIVHANKESGKGPARAMQLRDIAGSVALAAMAVTAIAFRKPDAIDPNRVEVSCMRALEGEPFKTFEVQWSDTHAGEGLRAVVRREAASGEPKHKHRAEAEKDAACREAVFRFMREHGVTRSYTVNGIEARVDYNRTEVKRACNALAKDGALQVEEGGKGVMYRMASTTEEVQASYTAGLKKRLAAR